MEKQRIRLDILKRNIRQNIFKKVYVYVWLNHTKYPVFVSKTGILEILRDIDSHKKFDIEVNAIDEVYLG